MFKYQIKETGQTAIVTFQNDLDMDVKNDLFLQVFPLLKNYKKVGIDFSGILFVDSTGIGGLMNLVRDLKELGISVSILNVSEDIKELFLLLRLPQVLGEDVFPDWNHSPVKES